LILDKQQKGDLVDDRNGVNDDDVKRRIEYFEIVLKGILVNAQ
jgi:hypothetical protein